MTTTRAMAADDHPPAPGCACGSGRDFDACCGPLLAGRRQAGSALELLRARYTAVTRGDVDFLMRTLSRRQRRIEDPQATAEWASGAQWLGLEVRTPPQGVGERIEIEFTAHYRAGELRAEHRERARFRLEEGRWCYDGGRISSGLTPVVRGERPGRNDPCPCGSGRKFKRCCGV